MKSIFRTLFGTATALTLLLPVVVQDAGAKDLAGAKPHGTIALRNEMHHQLIAQSLPSSMVSPVFLYRRCWNIINAQFFDKTYGGQDWSRWEHHYDTKIKTKDDAYKAIESMLASLGDPYTRFLNPDAFADETNQIKAHLYGVGIQLGMSELKKIVVIAPIAGSPAATAGVLPGDEILEVDGEMVAGQPLDSVVKKIRGPINTKVTLTMLRDSKRVPIPLVRAEIPVKAVTKAVILPGNVGYIRLDSFISSKATEEVKEALTKVDSADSIVLDLRNNPGGLLDNAVQIANLFLKGGVIVSTLDGADNKASTISRGQPSFEKPIVTLINGSSASASEILAGALKENDRSVLVGTKSFGKGLVQAIQKLDDGSGMNYSIAKYLTAGGNYIHKKGILPNIEVKLADEEYKKGLGPWWIDPTFKRFNREPTDGFDIQLLAAIAEAKNEVRKAKGQPIEPFKDDEVRKQILAKLGKPAVDTKKAAQAASDKPTGRAAADFAQPKAPSVPTGN
ncbi:MAG: peptidase S41 [Cyanobacteria bacterium PR.3.49]|nr:peptidase S41 [Cyanobacteria bacterium PR.3.49]